MSGFKAFSPKWNGYAVAYVLNALGSLKRKKEDRVGSVRIVKRSRCLQACDVYEAQLSSYTHDLTTAMIACTRMFQGK